MVSPRDPHERFEGVELWELNSGLQRLNRATQKSVKKRLEIVRDIQSSKVKKLLSREDITDPFVVDLRAAIQDVLLAKRELKEKRREQRAAQLERELYETDEDEQEQGPASPDEEPSSES